MKEKIIEGNNLIAVFRGLKYQPSVEVYDNVNQDVPPYIQKERWIENSNDTITPIYDELKYHSSWDWLMPVVEEIENLKEYREDGKDVAVGIWMALKYNHRTLPKIEAVWLAIVTFIKWYNSYTKTEQTIIK